jgi:hypothetical protein
MPDLEYTIEVSAPLGWPMPDADKMAQIVHAALEREYGEPYASLTDVEVTRVSDDL